MKNSVCPLSEDATQLLQFKYSHWQRVVIVQLIDIEENHSERRD
jgi:hypothetical protein